MISKRLARTQGGEKRKNQGLLPRGAAVLVLLLMVGYLAWGQDTVSVPAPVAIGKVIREVRVEGNTTVAPAIILKRVQSRVGAVYSEELANEDLRRVITLPEVAHARLATTLEGDQINLIFMVDETPRIKALNIIGNKDRKTEKLLKELKFKAGDFLDRYLAQRGAIDLREYYHKKGFYYVEVTLDEATMDREQVVNYMVIEGPRLRIKKLRFEGSKSYGDWKLKSKIKTGAYFPIFSKGQLDDQMLEQDRLALTAFYHDQGFLDARVFFQKELNEKKSRAWVTFVVEEGPRYFVDAIRFQGNEVYTAEDLQAELGKFKPGKPFTHDHQERSEKAVKNAYGREGYIEADVSIEPEFTEKPGQVDAVFKIKERNQYSLNRLIVQGNYDTQDKVVRREFDRFSFLPGDIYNSEAADKAKKRLVGQGLFEDVTVTPTGYDPNMRDALVEVKEGRTGLLLFGVGVDTDSGMMGQIMIEQRNFDAAKHPKSFEEFITGQSYKGGGQRLTFDFQPGTRVTRGRISFYEPYLFDTPYYFNTSLYLFRRWRESYLEQRIGGSVTFGRHLDNNWDADVTFRLENIKINGLETDYTLRDPLEIRTTPTYAVDADHKRYRLPREDWDEVYVDQPVKEPKDPANPNGPQQYVRVPKYANWPDGPTKIKRERVKDVNGNEIPRYRYREIVVAPPDVQDVEGSNFLTSIKFGVSHDTTDNIFRPTEGHKFHTTWEQVGAMGGDFQFSNVNSGVSFFHTLYEDLAERRTVLSERVIGGTIFGDAPVFERYYAGGINSMRGFDYRGISPQQRIAEELRVQRIRRHVVGGVPEWTNDIKSVHAHKYPIGSDSIFLAGTELNQPIFEQVLFGKLFCDTGTVTTGRYRVTVGFGIDIVVPQLFQMVPMQFDFGFPILKDDEDDTQLFSFSFGVTF